MEKIRLNCKAGSESHRSMKPTKALHITDLTLCIAIICGCQKQEDKSGQESTTASGTIQVIYFRFTDQGLDDNNGNVLLSPERYTAALRQRLEERYGLPRE